MKPTPIPERLQAAETLYGVIVKMPNPAAVEICGHAGFDLVVIDTEHGPDDAQDLERHILAAEAAGIEPWVRVGEPNPSLLGRVLDAGVRGLVVPHVADAATAAAVTRAAHYPPRGARSLAVSTRAGRYGFVPLSDHVDAAARETTVVVQFEDGGAIDELAGIAASPKLDAIFIGPADISASLGVPGQFDHPKVREVIDRAVEEVLGGEGPVLCVVVDDEQEARQWRERGAGLILFSASAVICKRLKELADSVHATSDMAVPLADASGDTA